MLQRALLFLSISSMASAVVEKTIPNPRQGESCNMGEPDFFVQLGKDKPSPVETCISKCVDDEFCEGMEFKAPRRCYLYYNRIGKFQDADEDTYCGRVKYSTESPKEYVAVDYTRCDVTRNPLKSTKTKNYTSQEECQFKCSTVKNCKAYQWNGKKNSCIIFKYSLTVDDAVGVPDNGPARVCGIVPKRKPNILLILADDLGTGDIPAYFNTSMVHMPNLNRLVAKGVTFKDVHSTPLCAPSRYMLLSGLYAHRGRNKGGSWSLKDNGNQFRGDQKSIAQTLRDGAKYNTFMTGKWHMGAKAPPNGLYDYSQTLTHPMHDWSKALIDGPQDIGFESSFITIGGIQAPPYSFFRDGFLTTKSSDVVYWENDSEHDMQCGRSIIGKESGEGSNDWDSTAYNMILVNETIGFVDKHLESKPENPFFAYVALGGVHIPHSPPDYYIDGTLVKGQYSSTHMDMLHEVDLVVGSLVSAMEERKLTEDTIIIFTSDNGGLRMSQQFSHYSNGILRGNKGQIWEGGHRVPMIWRYDGVFPENENREHLLGLNDIFATLCEIAGVDVPYGSAYDSVSFAPYIASPEKTEGLRKYLGTWAYTGDGFQHAIRHNDLKLVHHAGNNAIDFFDLKDDISEMLDLSTFFEDPETMKSMYRELIALGPCPDDVSGTFKLSKTLAEVECSWFQTNTNKRCGNHIEGELLCNSICGRYKNPCKNSLFQNGKVPNALK